MKVRILVVDDEVEICDMLTRHFRFLGYDAVSAPNGHEALEIIQNNPPSIVISDIKMPVMDGTELLRTLRHEYPMIHVIMITGYVTLDNALTCMRLGADTLVFKPLEDLRELENAVERAVSSITHWLDLLKELRAMKPKE